VVTAVVPMTLGASRRGRGVLLAAIALVQCYATRTQDGCAALSYHATMAECRVLAEDYRRFDSKALACAGISLAVRVRCDRPQAQSQTGSGFGAAGPPVSVSGDGCCCSFSRRSSSRRALIAAKSSIAGVMTSRPWPW
jgi:hypothetical protein